MRKRAMSSKRRRRLSIAMHEAWISNDRPTDRNRVLEILETLDFSDADRHENRPHSNFQPTCQNDFTT